MKLTKQHTDKIKSRFQEMESKEDLVALINLVNQMLYGENCELLELKKFAYYCNPKFSTNRYTEFSIPKKNGDRRQIHAPVNGLKHILKPLNIILNTLAVPHFKATGFVPGKSIVDNAKLHVGKHYVYNIDLKDFFHSFDRQWVKYGFMIPPFSLGKEKEELAFLMASLCTHPFEIDGKIKTVLPQGSPTSPTITNILCVKLDRRLNGLAKRFNINYSRYADDISFSSQTNVFKKDEFLNELHRIIGDQKLEINPAKTRTQMTGYRQETTGLIVNEKVNVNRRYVKQLRNWLYLWERYGIEKATEKFQKDYKNPGRGRGYSKNDSANFKQVLNGKLLFLKMVKGEEDSTYQKLKKRFDKLQSCSKTNKLIEIWQKEGIEAAIMAYNNEEKPKMDDPDEGKSNHGEVISTF
ncbi:MAG: reverse transcriptase family protein [Psychroflexus halocasei]